jgi:hypothetical protein
LSVRGIGERQELRATFSTPPLPSTDLSLRRARLARRLTCSFRYTTTGPISALLNDKGEVVRAEPLDVVQLSVELVKMVFFVVNECLEYLFGRGVSVLAALQDELVVRPNGLLFHLGSARQDLLRIRNLLDRSGGNHLHVAPQEQDPFGTPFNMAHLHYRDALEHRCQRREPLIVKVEMPVHVLVDRLQFVGHSRVQQFNGLCCIHRDPLDKPGRRSTLRSTIG